MSQQRRLKVTEQSTCLLCGTWPWVLGGWFSIAVGFTASGPGVLGQDAIDANRIRKLSNSALQASTRRQAVWCHLAGVACVGYPPKTDVRRSQLPLPPTLQGETGGRAHLPAKTATILQQVGCIHSWVIRAHDGSSHSSLVERCQPPQPLWRTPLRLRPVQRHLSAWRAGFPPRREVLRRMPSEVAPSIGPSFVEARWVPGCSC